MTRAPVLAALIGHWRRHPVELATLLIGVALATALWTGVQALNAQARQSYAAAAAVLGGDRLATVAAIDGQRFPLADYVALRRAGWKVSPVLEGEIVRDGAGLRLIGVDPVTLPAEAAALGTGEASLTDLLLPPHLMLAAPETAARLAGAADLPPRRAAPNLPPDTLVTDIGVAERLLAAQGEVSRLLLPAGAHGPLPAGLASRLEVRPPEAGSDLARLTDSFHLNLTAFGFLSFVVGLFIVYAAIGLAFEQRRPTLRTLRACGVSARHLTAALLAELVGLALAGALAGVAAGYLIAAALLPDVAASLHGLYGAELPGRLSLSPAWWLAGLGIGLAGALAAAASSLARAWRLPLLATAQPQAWRAAQRRELGAQAVAAAALAAAALVALARGTGLAAGFAGLGALLLAAALALPALLAAALALGARLARRPVAAWAWADAQAQLSGLSLALMALLLALAVNVGVSTMVGSFRQTFLGWLDQRLAAELYVTGLDPAQAPAVAAWLATRPEVTAVLPVRSAETRLGDRPVELYGFQDHATYRDAWPLLAATPGAWDQVARGAAVLVSEQLARRLHLGPGDTLALPTPAGPWAVPIAAVYADYGNPLGQVMLAGDALARRWPEAQVRRLAVRADPAAVPALVAELVPRLGPGGAEAVDQRALKAASRRIFEKTFAVTVALDALTLAVAGIALLTSLLTLSSLRLAQLAPLWALGLTRNQLAILELAKALVLAGITALAALPLGLAVAWVLTAVINVEAFGWRLPVVLFPGKWLALLALALLAACLAALWPALRLRRVSPLALLQSFSNER